MGKAKERRPETILPMAGGSPPGTGSEGRNQKGEGIDVGCKLSG
ncbi:MAG: hypothetical protein PHP32_00775 [Candidatus Izemoplasmatales bacterium]|nr:hypothetical protein [Candidatus Izemoplasmatales bacterium]